MENVSIEFFSFGKITIDGTNYTDDVIIYPGRVRSGWWRKRGHELLPEDLSGVVEVNPDVLVVGTGVYGRLKIPDRTKEYLKEKRIDLVSKRTENAIDHYDDISKGEQSVIATLHLSC